MVMRTTGTPSGGMPAGGGRRRGGEGRGGEGRGGEGRGGEKGKERGGGVLEQEKGMNTSAQL